MPAPIDSAPPSQRAKRVLSNRASFWTAAGVVTLALWASGAPSMVYPIYVAEWGISSVGVTTIFALYPVSLVLTLVVFGGISDYIGRRATMMAGMTAMAIGIVAFAVAPDVGWLFAGRIIQGIGVGLAMSPASAALVEFNPTPNQNRAASINAAATAVGFGMSSIVGGALVEYGPMPSHFSYWVVLGLTIALIVVLSFMPRAVPGTLASGRWRPRGIVVPKGIGLIVFTGAFALAASFTTGSIMQSLGSQVAEEMVGTRNALVAGAVLALAPLALTISSLLARRVPPRTAIVFGGVGTALGMLGTLISALTASIPTFIVATILSGCGYALMFLGGIGLVNRYAPVHHRAQTLSVVFLVAYLSQGLMAVVIGATATASTLTVAVEIWIPVIASLCLGATAIALSTARRAPAMPAESAA